MKTGQQSLTKVHLSTGKSKTRKQVQIKALMITTPAVLSAVKILTTAPAVLSTVKVPRIVRAVPTVRRIIRIVLVAVTVIGAIVLSITV